VECFSLEVVLVRLSAAASMRVRATEKTRLSEVIYDVLTLER